MKQWTARVALAVASVVNFFFPNGGGLVEVLWLALEFIGISNRPGGPRYTEKRTAAADCAVGSEKYPFLLWSATELAAAIREQRVTSARVTEACIDMIQRTHGLLNAVVADRFEEARREASAADQKVVKATAEGKLAALPPFLGVPLVSKGAFEHPGLLYTNFQVGRATVKGAKHCVVGQRAVNAGFIVLGVGNGSEACMWFESYNRVFGRTSSPYDSRRTSGGSSGGTAASVSALGAPLGLTADVGGSTRIPCYFCGLFGHKPTGGALPNTGTHCDAATRAVCTICQPGVCVRYARDLWPAIELLAGKPSAEEDPSNHSLYGDLKRLSKPLGKVTVYTLRPEWGRKNMSQVFAPLPGRSTVPGIGMLARWLLTRYGDELLEPQRKAEDALRRAGHHIQEISYGDIDADLWWEFWSSRMHENNKVAFHEQITENLPKLGPMELFRWMAGRSNHTFPALVLAAAEFALDLTPKRNASIVKLVEVEFRDKLKGIFNGGSAVVLMPTLPFVPPIHDKALVHGIFPRLVDVSFTMVWNVTEMASTHIPLGLGSDGIPRGVQIACDIDEVPIALAVQLEEAKVARWEPPKPA
mmetsp:Transcript_1075/g.2586  ORF Transcript_1075/g.2586 Transcript_1075/m.2586 type:complete len:587 (+) Transcript_1075:41-1801(+)